jgi:4-hydroxybenzoyl-CoA thioesterase
MSRTVHYAVAVEFGDCDPAGIVFFPNFFRWIDAAGRHYFIECGVPSWTETERTHGILGTPIVDVSARFMKPASYGDRLTIATTIDAWRRKSFTMHHVIARDATTLVEADEVRVFARRVAGERHRIEAVDIPDFIRSACG